MDKVKKYLIAAITISLFGELYFYPFQGDFRFSAGVLAISLTLLLFTELKEIYIALLTGLMVLILRGFIHSIDLSRGLIGILQVDLPGSLYYIFFGVLGYFLSLRDNRDNPMKTILNLAFIDVISNIFESSLRQNFNLGLFRYILLVALGRSVSTYIIFLIFRNQEVLIRKKEHQKRYTQLNTIMSNIQAEMFYLTKSMKDIENIMSKSYKLYESNKEVDGVGRLALDIAREVHEIKKDYYRVVSGLENFLGQFEENDSMGLKDIGYIIEDNINRYIKQNKKDINISLEIKDNIYIKRYYSLFTILNNLIINAIDASRENGFIEVLQEKDSKNLILTVRDNGEGIDEDIIPYIFNPGFTTKFDENSGEASTGIGLSHVKNIVEDLQGSIDIESIENEGTTFTISIPLTTLER